MMELPGNGLIRWRPAQLTFEPGSLSLHPVTFQEANDGHSREEGGASPTPRNPPFCPELHLINRTVALTWISNGVENSVEITVSQLTIVIFPCNSRPHDR